MCKTGQSTFENILAQEFDIFLSLQEWHNIFTNLQTGFSIDTLDNVTSVNRCWKLK